MGLPQSANGRLGQRYAAIAAYSGLTILVGGLLSLSPLCVLAVYPSEWRAVWGFLPCGVPMCLLGMWLWRLRARARAEALSIAEGGVIVTLGWTTVCLFSAIPFMLLEGQSFTQAVFEAVSGWTTTGLSIVDVTGASHPLLLWRSIMQLAGGAGLALITMASIAGPLGPGLSAAEGRAQQLVPHVRRSAAVLLRIYSLYVAAGVLALWAAGMSLFDAVNHAFCAVSTGGFSTQPESIGHWQSPAIEIVTVILMVLGSINYRTAYLVMQGRGAALLRNGEVRLALVLLAASALLVGLLVVPETGVAGGRALRIAVFETASATTTAGFSTTSYANWPAIGVFALILLMLIGGGTSSTAGGMKQYRAYLLLKAAAWELRGALLPRSVVTADYIWDGEQKQYVNDAHIKQAATFGVLYFGTYILGVLLLVGHGYPLQDAMFEYASCVGTVGLSVGVTSPETPGAVTWVQTAGMFLGRLEFSIIIVSVLKLIGDARQLAAGNRG